MRGGRVLMVPARSTVGGGRANHRQASVPYRVSLAADWFQPTVAPPPPAHPGKGGSRKWHRWAGLVGFGGKFSINQPETLLFKAHSFCI
ncbi:hypothetical protein XENTR_v10013130 [Xenopus tropicalis]|nr:hypothetical protein XENTR_v10013130 [Xenopus tropicalis]